MLNPIKKGALAVSWRVFWVPPDAVRRSSGSVVEGWDNLPSREDAVGVMAGDPIFLSPDHLVDPLLSLYGQSGTFRCYEEETRRNYATDIALLLTFLWKRGRSWLETTPRDLEDYEHWRRRAEGNPSRVGGAKWGRELAAFAGLFRWAVREGHLVRSPLAVRQIVGRNGEVISVPEAAPKDVRPSNVHWLTPRTWRKWIDVGLRGYTRGGIPQPGWFGRLEDRNVAFVRLLTSSGLRRGEDGSLLTFELPVPRIGRGRYCRGKVAAAVTRSKRPRTFYAAADALGDVEAYVDSSRAWMVRKAQQAGRYEQLAQLRLVTEVTRGLKPKVRWRDRHGAAGERELNLLSVRERMLLFTEGPHGPEPSWLWLNEQGLPFRPHSCPGGLAR